MSQPILERLSIQLSNRLGDGVSVFTANGITITAEKRLQAINEAIGELYEARLMDYAGKNTEKPESFTKVFPDYRGLLTFLITDTSPNSRALAKPENVRKVISCLVNANDPAIQNKTAIGYDETNYYKAISWEYSNIKPTTEQPGYFEHDKLITVEYNQAGGLIETGSVKFAVLLQPVKVNYGDTDDVLMPVSWERDVIALAAKIAMDNRQS